MDECRREPFKTREGREIRDRGSRIPNGCYGIKPWFSVPVWPSDGFAGIYDKDEAERIVENTAYTAERQPERDILRLTMKTMQEINTLLIAPDKTWDDDFIAALFPDISPRHSRIVRIRHRPKQWKLLIPWNRKPLSRRWRMTPDIILQRTGSTWEPSNRGWWCMAQITARRHHPLQKFTT